MTRRSTVGVAAAIAIVVLAAGSYGSYRLGVTRGMSMSPNTAGSAAAMKAGDIDPATGRKVLYWHDPMVPGRRFDAPGKSPFMNMMLVPVYEGDNGGATVSIDPRLQQNLGIRTAKSCGARSRLASRRSATSLSTSATRRSCRSAPRAIWKRYTCARHWTA